MSFEKEKRILVRRKRKTKTKKKSYVTLNIGFFFFFFVFAPFELNRVANLKSAHKKKGVCVLVERSLVEHATFWNAACICTT